jgi:hypothetical protein
MSYCAGSCIRAWARLQRLHTISNSKEVILGDMVDGRLAMIVGAEIIRATGRAVAVGARAVEAVGVAAIAVDAAGAVLRDRLPVLEGRVSGQEISENFRTLMQTRGQTHIPLAGRWRLTAAAWNLCRPVGTGMDGVQDGEAHAAGLEGGDLFPLTPPSVRIGRIEGR